MMHMLAGYFSWLTMLAGYAGYFYWLRLMANFAVKIGRLFWLSKLHGYA
jgi:hypothetical protein